MPGEPLLPEGETPRETPLPEGVMDEIHRLREEHDRNASREKGVRSTRVRTDADRAREKERSARRRREQTDEQRERERLRSLKRRRAMTPEERKAASVKRVARRQAQRAGAEFRSRTLLVTAQIAEHPTTHATNATGPGPGLGPGPVDGSAEDESASFARQNAEKGIADEDPADPAADLLDALRGDPLGVLNAHPVDDALGDPAGGAGSFAASTKTDTRAAEAERRRLEEERARSAHRRARMTAEEKQLQNQARHARRQRAKAAGLAGLEDPPGADPARVEGTLGGDDE
jgi:hypothetical protein